MTTASWKFPDWSRFPNSVGSTAVIVTGKPIAVQAFATSFAVA